MSFYYVLYDAVGNITNTGSVSQEIDLPVRTGRTTLVSDQEYILGQVFVDLTTETILPKSDYTLDTLPLPCTLTIEGVDYYCTEQPTFEFNYPGVYKIKVDAGAAFLKKEFEIDYQS